MGRSTFRSKPDSASGSAASTVANSRSRSTRNSRPSKTWCTSSRSHWRRSRSAGFSGRLEVAHQSVEAPVAQHALEVLAQVVAGLALDLVDVGHHALQAAVQVDPLGGRLRPDARDAGQVVAALAHQRRQVGVALGGRP
ncbi:hypothetical protein GCM10025868_02950 [Angustibacter aerolatus]|uniref:Uncharacterized protein n=1 Tax=Angustibacter aerolatus TaxID=1162965 RepID=A0ABQ6JDY9_9ACTN|nr:hypothetical protein GCM10025868_02950 [Angustibacter aerolatus]